MHIPEALGGGDDGQHAAAGERDLALVFDAVIDDLLDAVDVGGEGGDDDAFVTAAENVVEALADLAFAHGKAGAFGVGALVEHGEYARLADLAEAGEVDGFAFDRGQVDLVVAGHDDGAGGAGDGDGAAVGDGMVDADELGGEMLAEADDVACHDAVEFCDVFEAVLDELVFDDAERQ